jgi:hypothetical protein
LEHQALAYVFQNFEERASKQRKVFWEGRIERDSQIYGGAVVLYHPQLDKFTGCPRKQLSK